MRLLLLIVLSFPLAACQSMDAAEVHTPSEVTQEDPYQHKPAERVGRDRNISGGGIQNPLGE